MLAVPAAVWRGGSFRRGVTLGVCGGVFFGAIACLDSGMWLAGAIVFVVLGVGTGVWMSRRMSRYWPAARELSGPDRETVVAATRRGDRVGDPALAPAVAGYREALHAAADTWKPLRWVIAVVLVVAVASAVWDAAFGSVGNVTVSVVYLVLIGLDLFWWPRWHAELLARADRAAALARDSELADDGPTPDGSQ